MKKYLIAGCWLALLAACKKPDQQDPYSDHCTAGQSVLAINDDDLPYLVKRRIYDPGDVITASDPKFNKKGKVVVIPISTSDFPVNTALTTQMIRDEYFTTGAGSASDYFHENSWGQYQLTEGQISATAVLPRGYYQYRYTESDWYLMRDVCQYSSINWPALDVNNDHNITPDEVQIVYLLSSDGFGGTARYPRNIFSDKDPDYMSLPAYITLQYTSGEYHIYNDFVRVDCKSNTNPYKEVATLRYNASTLWHELCHALFQLPDRYSGGGCGTGNTGQFDLMSNNCARVHMNVYDKMRIGWIKPRIVFFGAAAPGASASNIQGGVCLSLPAIESQPAALIRWNAASPDECWIFENRHMASSTKHFESGLPDEGLAIWWLNLMTGDIHLVDAHHAGTLPTTFRNQGSGALFKYPGTPVQSLYQALLSDQQGKVAFGVKSISPAGSILYFSF